MNNHESLIKLSAYSIVEKYMNRAKCDEMTALKDFYNSQLYQLYADEKTKLWHYSTEALAGMLYDEMQTGVFKLPDEE